MEEEKERSPSLRELQEELSDLVALREHRGFKRFQRLLGGQCQNLIADTVLKPIATWDETLGQEFRKGQATALRQTMHLLDDQIPFVQEQIAEKLKEEEDKHAIPTANA